MPSIQSTAGRSVALILAPARELALQIYRETKRFASVLGLRCTAVYGGAQVAQPLLREVAVVLAADALVVLGDDVPPEAVVDGPHPRLDREGGLPLELVGWETASRPNFRAKQNLPGAALNGIGGLGNLSGKGKCYTLITL